MQTRWRVSSLLTLILILALAAGYQRSHLRGRKAPAQPGWDALIEAMARMHASMSSVRPSGYNDVDFVALMLPHHQTAIDMAKAELLFGSDPQVRRLAQEVITDQQSEIALMQLWLKRRNALGKTSDRAPATRE